VHAEELPALLSLYERNGYFDEIISLMEGGLGLERAHMVRRSWKWWEPDRRLMIRECSPS
jgi:clathrin heavy chain